MAKTPVSTIAQFAPLTISLRGKVVFSRVASQISGAELAKQNQEAAAKGRIPHQKPYITITIKNPTFMDNGTLPAQVKSVISERFYTSKTDGSVLFTQESKSPWLPTIVYSPLAGELAGQGIADQNVPLQAEFAKDLDVTIGVSLFSKNNFAGLGINYIMVNEPIRYYSGSPMMADLAAQGITYTAPVAQVQQPMGQPIPYTSNIASQPVSAPVPQQTYQAMAPQQSFVPPTMPDMPDKAPWEIETPFTSDNFTDPNQVQKPVRYY